MARTQITPPESSAERFAVRCPVCARTAPKYLASVGQAFDCDRCGRGLIVPGRGDGDVTPAATDPTRPGRLFSFECARCHCLLEAHSSECRRPGSCPTCGAEFEIPVVDLRTGLLLESIRPPPDLDDPTPMHAYAANGRLAPEIMHRDGDQLAIQCRRCGTVCPIEANACTECGVPFTMEALEDVRTASDGRGGRGTAALVLGVLSVPLALFVLPAVLAVMVSIADILRTRDGQRVPRSAIVGGILGMISLGLAVLLYVAK